MKHLILLAALFSGTAAHADFETKFNLDYFQFDAGSHLAKRDINSGTVAIDTDTNELRITLNPAFHCPEGRACAMMMPAPIQIQAPIQTVSHDRCGNSIINAGRDDSRFDGVKVDIQVIDSTASRCSRPNIRIARPVIVMLSSGPSRGMRATSSTLGGFRAEEKVEGIHCRDLNAGPDHGFYATFTSDLKSVKVSSQSIMGPRPVASLDCQVNGAPVMRPDAPLMVTCYDPAIMDAGYAFELDLSSRNLMKPAQLFSVSKRGHELVAKLACRR